MNNTYKVNQKRKNTAAQVAEILNTCEILFELAIYMKGSDYVLSVAVDDIQVEYTEADSKGMSVFLELLSEYAENKDDIQELIEEMKTLEIS